jgi:hypothetical protein
MPPSSKVSKGHCSLALTLDEEGTTMHQNVSNHSRDTMHIAGHLNPQQCHCENPNSHSFDHVLLFLYHVAVDCVASIVDELAASIFRVVAGTDGARAIQFPVHADHSFSFSHSSKMPRSYTTYTFSPYSFQPSTWRHKHQQHIPFPHSAQTPKQDQPEQ